MQNKKKGFTLIELLAVIVILAIIALIAVPVIMNVITKARKSAFEDSAYGIVKAGEMYYTNKLLETSGMTRDKEFTISGNILKSEDGDTLDVSGSLPSVGKVTVTSEGKVALAISNGEYCIRKATTESEIKAEPLGDLNGVCGYKTVFTTATDGTSIPACITNNTTCNVAAAGNDGIKVGVKVNNSETKDFYVMSEDTSKGTITLIMNQNLGGNVAWVSEDDYVSAGGTEADWGNYGNNNKGPITALNYLESQTSSWTNIPLETYELTDDNSTPKYTAITRTARARLITKSETSTLGCTTSSGSCPTWLCGNLNIQSGPYGYWTSSAYVSGFNGAWSIESGHANNSTDYSNFAGVGLALYGVRPVITVSKIIL